MNIFDPHITGSLSVSGSAEVSGDLTVLGTINATISGTTTNAISASHAAKYLLTSSFEDFTSSYTTGSFTGSFIGDGGLLYNIPASGVTGLNLSQISNGSITASVSTEGFNVNSDMSVTGAILATGDISGSFVGDGSGLYGIPASGVTGLNLTQIADGVVTASVSNANGFRVNSNTEITGNLVVTGDITGSANFNTLSNKPTLVSGSSQVNITGTTDYTTFSSSISTSVASLSSSLSNTIGNLSASVSTSIGGLSSSVAAIDSTHNSRLDLLETSSGSLNSYTSSNTTNINAIHVATGSLNTYTSSNNDIITSINSTTSSLNSYTSSNTSNITAIHTATSSLNSYTASNTTNINAIHTATSSLNSFTSSASGKLTSLESASSSIRNDFNSYTGSNNGRVGSLETASGSLNNYTASNTTNINAIHTATSSLNTFTSSATTRLGAIETATSSLNSFTSSIDTTIKNKLNSETVVSGSSQISITGTTGYSTFSSSISASVGELSSSVATTTNNLSSSIATTNSNQDNKITFLELKTGSYATTGSNTFVGNQVISGSVIIRENLTVLGSSSITYTTSSQLRVNDNVITVNTSNPAERFGGLQVYDSGSLLEATGSLLWDSEKNRWIYQQSSEASYGGGVLLSGPRSSGSLGDELTLTSGKIARSAGGDHLNDSIITEYSGTTIGISGSLEITGSIISSITPLVSGSSQISFNGIIDKPTLVSGSSQIIYSGLTGVPSGIVSGSSQVLSGTGIWSGSAQLPSGVVSGSSQVLSGTGIWSGSAQLPSGVVSGSAQVLSGTTIHSGTFFNGINVISGSSQIDHNTTTNYVANQHIDHTTVSITAGSGLSGGGDITTTRTLTLDTGSLHLQNGIKSYLNTQTVVSGSSQILNGSGIWSGSAQLPSGVVSGSVQVLGGTGIWSGSAQLPSGVVSGSAQIIAGLPSGTVSGSSQITLSSTTGFGTYLNQAVLTTSNPTFNSIIASDHRSTGTGYITYDTDNAGTNSLIIRKYGTTVATYNSSGNLVLTGTITATNFSGTSSGTNTGDQTNITGNAGTVTNGLYTTGDQTITGQKTFPSDVPNRPILSGGFISAATGDLDVDIWGISEDYYPSHATAANAWGLRWYGTGNEFRFVGGGTNRVIMDMDTGDITSTGIISGTTIYGTWNGVAIANNYLANSSFYVGTTSISLGRSSASQTLSGVSIDGTAASETLATVTARGASTSAAVTFNSTSLTMSSHYYTNMYGTNETYVHFYPSGGNGGNYSAVNWRFWTTASGTKVLRAGGDGSFTWDGSTVKTLSNTSYATTFTSVSSITVTHNLGTKDVMVMCYDSSDAMFWPSSIVTISTTQVTITFTTNRTGRVVVTR